MYCDDCTAPEITEGPVDVTEFVDSRLMMACAARGDPRPTIQWQKRNGTGGRWIHASRTSERYRVQRSGNLVIRRLLASDAGLFRCVAENTVGAAYSAAATLVVQGLLWRVVTLLITDADCVGRGLDFRVHLSVCLFVCPQHNSKANDPSVHTWYGE